MSKEFSQENNISKLPSKLQTGAKGQNPNRRLSASEDVGQGRCIFSRHGNILSKYKSIILNIIKNL